MCIIAMNLGSQRIAILSDNHATLTKILYKLQGYYAHCRFVHFYYIYCSIFPLMLLVVVVIHPEAFSFASFFTGPLKTN